MICPSKTCRIEIDDDSKFCDHCGSEILICPKCQTTGTGKFCPKDGQRLESRKRSIVESQQIADSHSEVVANQPPAQPQHTVNNKTTRIDMNSIPSVNELIITHTSGLELRIKDKDLLGRSEGPHAQHLENFKFISRQHATILMKSGNWYITDLGSTNRTKVNGVLLEPNTDCQIKKGDRITLADQEFIIK